MTKFQGSFISENLWFKQTPTNMIQRLPCCYRTEAIRQHINLSNTIFHIVSFRVLPIPKSIQFSTQFKTFVKFSYNWKPNFVCFQFQSSPQLWDAKFKFENVLIFNYFIQRRRRHGIGIAKGSGILLWEPYRLQYGWINMGANGIVCLRNGSRITSRKNFWKKLKD